MRNACFIIPYFGTLPDQFDIFLRTCEQNTGFDWLIVTDDHSEYSYPANVHVQYTTFQAFVERVQSHFDFPIGLYRPYKVCDFRAAFGVIFEEELRDYRFWGHCDLDQYFGDISAFITDEVLEQYDKILCLGHFTFFRNTPKINDLYMTEDRTFHQSYRDAFLGNGHWIFDEWPSGRTSINKIFKQEKIHTYYNSSCFCDLIPFHSRFVRTLFDPQSETWTPDKVKNEIYLWREGKLLRCWVEDGSLQKQEILYTHIRQRKMSKKKYQASQAELLIVPNRFVSSDHFSDEQICRYWKKAQRRGYFRPDEISRRWHGLTTFVYLVFRRLKRILKKKYHTIRY